MICQFRNLIPRWKGSLPPGQADRLKKEYKPDLDRIAFILMNKIAKVMIRKRIPNAIWGCGATTKIKTTVPIANTNPFHQLSPNDRNPAAIMPHHKNPAMADQASAVNAMINAA